MFFSPEWKSSWSNKVLIYNLCKSYVMQRKFIKEISIRNRDEPTRIFHGSGRDERERKETTSREIKYRFVSWLM